MHHMRVGSGFRRLQWAKQHDFLLLPGASDIVNILLCINCWCVHTVNTICCALLYCVHYFPWIKTYITQHPTLCFKKLVVPFQFVCGLKCQWSYSWHIYGQQLDLWWYGEYRHRPSTRSQLSSVPSITAVRWDRWQTYQCWALAQWPNIMNN